MSMRANLLQGLRRRWGIERGNVRADLIAGLTLGIESIPDAMASALLAGTNPLVGLYTLMIATPIAALVTSSEMMNVTTTSAISLAVGSSLAGMAGGDKLQAVFVLSLLVGVIQMTLGLLKMGFLVRFVPFSVMTGFLNGVAVLIILGQFEDLTGYRSSFSNRVAKTLDTALNIDQIIVPTVAIGLTTIILILVLARIKPISEYSLVVAMILASAAASLPGLGLVPLVGDVTDVPHSLPHFVLPEFAMIGSLIVPAIAISLIGLVQGAGISQTYPNADGKFPNPSGDFFGQGVANLAAGFFQGMPTGGSISGTALVVSAGAKSRWANVFVGVIVAIIVLLFADLVKLIAMPALAGLLMVVGFQTIKMQNIKTVWQTGVLPRTVMLITFVGTLIMPLQYAVFLGVAISILLFVGQQANRVTLVELVPGAGGFPIEQAPPRRLRSRQITALTAYGSLFYAGAKTLEDALPDVDGAEQPVVIFLMRGHDEFGSTLIGVLDRYCRAIQRMGGKVLIAGIGEKVLQQLQRTKLLDLIGRENVFLAQAQWGLAGSQAYEAAQRWLDVQKLTGFVETRKG